MMGELIRKQTVLNMLDDAQFTHNYTKEEVELLTKIHTAVNAMYPVDAVEVVRCEYCKYKPVGTGCNHDLEFPVHYKCPCECDDYWYSWMPKDDFFCGNGERKETDG